MNLNEFAVGIVHALLKQSGLRRASADNGICRAAKNGADAAGAENNRVGCEGAQFHGAQIHGADTAADAGVIDYGGKKSVAFVLFYFAFGFVAADLLVESVEKLLSGGRASEGGA